MFLWGLAQIAVSSLVALAMALLYGHLTPTISVISLFVGAVAASFLKRSFKNQPNVFKINYWNPGADGWIEKILFLFLIFISYRHFNYLFYLDGNSWKTLNPFNYGDLPLHITYIRAMALGNDFPLQNPIFAGEVLRYPYGIDLYNALWDSLGVPLQTHLFAVGLFGAIASIIALRAVASWWGMMGFFLSGGMVGWYGYALTLEDKVQWKNLFLAVLVTQRGFLFALPVGLFILKQISDKRMKFPALWFGFLWGSLGFFHLHSFVALSIIIGVYAFWNGKLIASLKSLLVALPLGGVFVLFSTNLFEKSNIVRIKRGWTYEGAESFWSFLSFNFGPYIFLYVLILMGLFWGSLRNKQLRSLIAPFILYSVLFVSFFNVMLAPWDWDNIKVLIWPYLGLLSIAFMVFQQRMHWLLKISLASVCAFSGVRVILPRLSLEKSINLYNSREIEAATSRTRALPRSAVFLTSESHIHVLGYLGRLRFIGYPGHLWAHGIDYDHQWKLYEKFSKSEPDWQTTFREMNIDYIYFGSDLKMLFGYRVQDWQTELEDISPPAGPAIYKIQKSDP